MKRSSSAPDAGGNFDSEDFQRKAGGCCFKCEGPCQLLLGKLNEVSSRRRKASSPKSEPEVKSKQLQLVDLPQPKPVQEVVVSKDHIIPYPELFMEIFVTEPAAETFVAEMFARSRCTQAKSLDRADLIVFTGGPDVNPKLYGETPHKETKFNKERDERDLIYYREALQARVPMLGICRGSQFLHVMQGGKLIQHLGDSKPHIGEHGICDKRKVSGNVGFIDRVPSTHHQAVLPQDGMEILASVFRSQEWWLNRDEVKRNVRHEDVEAYFYRKNCILGVQGHPEYRGYARYTNYVLKLIEEKICGCPDVALEDNNYRVKRDIILLDKQ